MFDLTNRQSFLNITRCQCYKTFYVRNLQIFVLSESVCRTKPEKLTNDKHSSSLRKSVIYGKKIYNIRPRCQCYNTFYVRNLQIFVLSESVCQTRPEKLTNDNHSSLLRKSVIYGKRSFITLGPGVNDIKPFTSVIYKSL
jgi:hypothetical protein